jgi:chondroitin 4-sulfotransferase 11
MISHEYKCIFVHIPKCAGMSIDRAFNYRHNHECHQHPHNYPEWKNPEYYKFTIVRNPYDRLVSAYSFLKTESQKKKSLQDLIPLTKNFDIFLREYISKLYTYPVFKSPRYQHIRPQMYWMSDGYDFIGRFENIKTDFEIVCERIGLKKKKLKHRNKTKHRHYIQYYTPETIKIVQRIYKEDLDFFGYTFGERGSSLP